MANEITKLGGGPLRADLLFIYNGLTPVQYTDALSGTQTVIPTPSANLPPIADLVVTDAEKADLDSGVSAFEVVHMPIPSSMTNPELLTAARALYATKKQDFITTHAARFNRVGQRFDEV